MTPRGALSFLGAYHLLQNSVLNRRGYVAGNLVATGVGVVWAELTDLDWRSSRTASKTRSDFKVGLTAVAIVASLAFLARNDERLLGALDDRRLDDVDDQEFWYRLLLRFPLGTALFEEVWFRCLLPAVFAKHGARHSEIASAMAFTVWHVIPTTAALKANERGRGLNLRRKAVAITAGSVVAGLGGLGFAAIRRMSGGLFAPWAAHASINALTFWLGMRRRRSNSV